MGSRGFLTLTNLIIMFFVSRFLGEEKLGIYSISTFFYYLFSFLTSFELTTYLGKEVAHRRERIDQLKRLVGEVTFTFLIGLAAAMVILTVVLLFYKLIDAPVLLISAFSGIIFGVEKNLSGILLGKEKMQYEFAAQLAAFAIVAVPVFLAVKQLDIIGIYVLRIGASLVTIFMRTYFIQIKQYVEKLSVSFQQVPSYNWKEIKFFSFSGFSTFVQHHIDPFILSLLISTELLGTYFLALRIYLAFCLLAEMTSFALTPYISRIYQNKEPGSFKSFPDFSRKILGTAVLLGAIASVTLFLTRDALISIFTKGDPELASGFLFYFSFLLFFRFISYYTGSLLTSTGHQKIRFYILVGSAVLLVGLESVLGKLFSVEGVIYARAVMELVVFTAYLAAFAKIRHKPVENDIITSLEDEPALQHENN